MALQNKELQFMKAALEEAKKAFEKKERKCRPLDLPYAPVLKQSCQEALNQATLEL